MSRTLLILGVWGLVTWGMASAAAQGTYAFESATFDFGEVAAGQIVSTVFEFENRTYGDIQIADVRPSCGCTVPEYPEGVIGPGESGTIVVEFDSANRSGAFRHTVAVVFTNGNGQRSTEFVEIRGVVVHSAMIAADRQGGVRFDRSEVDLGGVPSGVAIRQRFMMQRTEGRELSILAAYSFPEGAKVTYPGRPIFRDEVVYILVEIPGEMVDGELDFTIALQTDDHDEPIKVLLLKGHAR